MNIENEVIANLEESIKAGKYPMAIDTNKCTGEITETSKKLASAKCGSAHDNYISGIFVSFDLTFSNKAWVEFERYHFAQIVSSQSTMHKITKLNIKKQCNKYVWNSTIDKLERRVELYNSLEDKSTDMAKELYLEILYNVPSGFELTARIATNYLQLKTIYFQRRNHRLPEWRDFCGWIEQLPYFKELVLGDKNE